MTQVRFALFAGLLGLALAGSSRAENQKPLNVLFIAVDDLRPELGCYGHPVVKTPNIDRLASQGTLFTRAYCQQAVCNPSRASLMTALRPESTGVMDLPTYFRDKRPNAVTVAQHFKENGYHSQGIGKIYHTGHGNKDDALSWSVREKFKRASRFGPEGRKLLARLRREAKAKGIDLKDPRINPRGLPWEAPDVADELLTDGDFCERAIKILREHKDEPFFLAVGFLNPHLPFVAPKKYWDLYDPEKIELADNPHPPKGSPKVAHTSWGELRKYYGMPKKGPLSEEQARTAIHGYWAATSYVDALVGRLLNELDRLGLRDDTVVILWGDHGWQLGEHGFWCKHTNYEVAARVPLIISVPGQKNAGAKSDALVEFVDVFPTLSDVCGLSTPEGLEGVSFRPLLDDPNRSWKKAAFHLYPRNIKGKGRCLGRAIRTDRYRLVEWRMLKDRKLVGRELYDLENDPDENTNLAKRPELAPVVAQLSGELKAGWRDALPE
ncbi:Arylsulfatase [Planctomycetes bacterium Pan216]|uniref:Arylsulfatase n=1 Tax=Kolteria novifilia TaxID=2527975 RepID=A0A518B3V9_9BACT|nr:Arylsulfatase [Planctomycetes bacterium Pan216]